MEKNADPQLCKWATSSLKVPTNIAKSDLYAIYTMVKDMKKEMVKSISYKPHPSPDAFKNGLSRSNSALSVISDSARSALSRSASTASLRAISEVNISDSDSISDSLSEGFSS